MFTDMVGSTQMRTDLGDRAADVLRRDHDRLLIEAVVAHGGVPLKNTGDGLVAVFESAADGVACAVSMQQSMDRYRNEQGAAIAIRVGVSAGDVAEEHGDYFGTPMVEAARLEAAAQRDQILVADIVRLLAGSRSDAVFTSVGELELKGLGRLAAFAVPWEPAMAPAREQGSERALPVGRSVKFPSGLETLRRGVFAGRVGELELLNREWSRVLAGDSAFVAVGGEPGMGKTRLTAEFAAQVHSSGGTVLFGRCDEHSPGALQPFAGAIGDYLRSAGVEAGDERLGWAGPQLGLLVPQLRTAATPDYTSRTRGSEPFSGGDRVAVLDAVTELLRTLGAAGPFLLVLDDLHWATEPTIALVNQLVHATRDVRFMLVGTYRDVELDRMHPFAQALAELRGKALVTRLPLLGLGEVEIAEIAAQHFGEAKSELIRSICDQTQGNAFFVGEIVRNLRDGTNDMSLPEGVKEVIGRRLSRLPDGVTRALRVAAVAGSSFTISILERIPAAADDADALLDALDAATEARLITEDPTAIGGFTFGHALIRQTLYDELSSARRARLHLAVAQALEADPARDDQRLSALAYHFCEAAAAGTIPQALLYSERAGRAVEVVAPEDALELANRALEVAALEPAGHGSARVDLLLLKADAMSWLVGSLDDLRALTIEALELARSVGYVHGFGRAAQSFAWYQDLGAPDPRAPGFLEEAIAALDDSEPGLRARLLAESVVRQPDIGRSPKWGWEQLQEALHLARQGRVEDLQEVLISGLEMLLGSPMADEGALLLAECESTLDSKPSSVLNNWRYFDAEHRLESASPSFFGILPDLHRGRRSEWSMIWTAQLDLFQGRFKSAEEHLNACLASASYSFLHNAALATLFMVGRERGEFREMLPLAERMIAENPGLAAMRAAVALAHADLGTDEARALLGELSADGFAALPRDSTWTGSLFLLAETCAIVADRPVAEHLYHEMLPYSNRMAVQAGLMCLGALDRGLGQLATTMQRWDDAERHYQRALELEGQLDAAPLVARTRYWYARMLLDRGSPDDITRAHALLNDVRETTKELGMSLLESQAEELRAANVGSRA